MFFNLPQYFLRKQFLSTVFFGVRQEGVRYCLDDILIDKLPWCFWRCRQWVGFLHLLSRHRMQSGERGQGSISPTSDSSILDTLHCHDYSTQAFHCACSRCLITLTLEKLFHKVNPYLSCWVLNELNSVYNNPSEPTFPISKLLYPSSSFLIWLGGETGSITSSAKCDLWGNKL